MSNNHNSNQECHSSLSDRFGMNRIEELEDEVELLREQVETLKLALRCEVEQTEEYRQELDYTSQELIEQCEELHLLHEKIIRLEELAIGIVKGENSINQYFPKLLSAICDLLESPELLAEINQWNLAIQYAKEAQLMKPEAH